MYIIITKWDIYTFNYVFIHIVIVIYRRIYLSEKFDCTSSVDMKVLVMLLLINISDFVFVVANE